MKSDTELLLGAGLIATGLISTLSAIHITRYFLLAVYPLPFVYVSYRFLVCDGWIGARAVRILGITVLTQLAVSAALLGFIHVEQASMHGDYATPLSAQENLKFD